MALLPLHEKESKMTQVTKTEYMADLVKTCSAILEDLPLFNDQKRFVTTYNRLVNEFLNDKISYGTCLGLMLNRYAQLKGIPAHS